MSILPPLLFHHHHHFRGFHAQIFSVLVAFVGFLVFARFFFEVLVDQKFQKIRF